MLFLVVGAYELRRFCTRLSVPGSEIRVTVLSSRRIVTDWIQQCEPTSPVISVFRVPGVMFLTIVFSTFGQSGNEKTKRLTGHS